jgi:hypothetical protein
MNTDLETRLSADMARFTRDVRVPAGLALQAWRHNRRRRATLRAAIASGTAAALAAGAIAIAGATGAFSSASAPPIQTTAYVVKQVDKALAPANLVNLVGFERTVFLPGKNGEPAEYVGTFTGSQGTCNYGTTLLQSQYRGITKLAVYTRDGQHLFDMKISPTGRSSSEITQVIYCNHTWWTDTGTRTGVWNIASGAAAGWPPRIRAWLSSGVYRVAGHQVVDGINTIKLTATEQQPTLWVNPVTYLPVRLGTPQVQTDYQWLTPTQAHLALLDEPIPAGFTRVPADT